jgi:hypothetical protein
MMYSRAVFAPSRVRGCYVLCLILDQACGREALSCGCLLLLSGRKEGGVRGSESEATKRWKFGGEEEIRELS